MHLTWNKRVGGGQYAQSGDSTYVVERYCRAYVATVDGVSIKAIGSKDTREFGNINGAKKACQHEADKATVIAAQATKANVQLDAKPAKTITTFQYHVSEIEHSGDLQREIDLAYKCGAITVKVVSAPALEDQDGNELAVLQVQIKGSVSDYMQRLDNLGSCAY